MKYKKIAFASAFLLAALTPQLQAQDIYKDWLGVTSDDWSDSSNWQDGYIPGTDPSSDTARIYNNTTSSPDSTAYNTALKSGSISLDRVWLGNSGDSNESGVLTVESGASLTTSRDFNLENNSTLTSSGAISVGSGNGMLVRDSANVTLKNGSTLNKLNLEQNSTATLEAGSDVSTLRLTGDSQVTMEAGSSASTIQIEADSHLTMNNTRTGGLNVNTRSSLTVNGTVDGNISYNTDGTGLIAETGTVDGNLTANRTSSVTVNGTVTGNLTANQNSNVIVNGTVTGILRAAQDSSVTLNGTVNGDIDNTSTSMLTIGAGGTVNGVLEVQNNEQVTVAGTIIGLFRVNGDTGQAIIESTANILSDSANGSTWINNKCSIRWNVGVDGSIGTLKSNVNESSLDAYDGEWLYHPTDNSMVVELSAYVPDGNPISLQPVSGLQYQNREDAFADKVVFIRNEEDISEDFTYVGAGTFTATILPDSYSTDSDGDGLMDNVETNTGTFVDATDTGTDPNDTDSDDDGLTDDVETGTGLYVSATDTGTDPNLADSDSDGMSDYDEVLYLGLDPNTDSTAAISLLPSTGGGVAQSEHDAVVAELANAREARTGSTVIDVANGEATITLTVEQTTDVSDWSNATSSDHDIQLTAPPGASFYRFNYPEE